MHLATKNLRVAYDSRVDALAFSDTKPGKSRYSYSVEFGNVIIDYDADHNFLGLEILDATRTLAALQGLRTPLKPSTLSSLTSATAMLFTKANAIILTLTLKAPTETIQAHINLAREHHPTTKLLARA